MIDEMHTEPDHNDATKEKDSRKHFIVILLLLLLLLIIVAVISWILLTCKIEPGDTAEPQTQPVSQPAGERFEFSAFYHSDDGTWIIRDEGILVLKERKFISASEKDEYTVHAVTPGERLKILEADQRWKRVEVFPGSGEDSDKPIATGWVDANNVRHVDHVEETQPTGTPQSHKAMKQQYTH